MTQGAWWLVAAVLMAPLAIFPAETGVGTTEAKNAVVIVLGLAVVIWRLPSAWTQALAAWAVLGFVLSGMRGWGVAGLLGVLAWLLVYGEAAKLAEPAWRRVRVGIAAAALGQMAWMVVQRADADPIFRPLSYAGVVIAGPAPAIGWFANPMDTALFLGLSLPALVALASSAWLGAALLLAGAAALVSLNATVGLVGIAATALWWAPTRRLRVVLAALLVLLGAWFVVVRDPGGVGRRPLIWTQLGHLVAANPLVGYGVNALGNRIHLIRATPGRVDGAERWEHAFNEWLQGALELGLVGPGLALGYLVTLAWRLRARWRLAQEAIPAALALLVMSTFSIPLRIGPVALLGAVYLGRLEAVAQEAQG